MQSGYWAWLFEYKDTNELKLMLDHGLALKHCMYTCTPTHMSKYIFSRGINESFTLSSEYLNTLQNSTYQKMGLDIMIDLEQIIKTIITKK